MNNFIKVAKAVTPLWIGSLIGSGSTFIIYIFLARFLGANNFGIFGAAISTASIFTLFAGMGVSQFWLKIFGNEGWDGLRWILPSLKFLLLSFSLTIILLITWAYIGPHTYLFKKILIIIPFFILGQISIQLVSAKFQLEERYSTLAIWQLSPNLCRLLTIFFLFYILKYNIDILFVIFIYALVGLLFFLLSAYNLYFMKNGLFQLKGHKQNIQNSTVLSTPSLLNIFKESWPFGIASLFAFIYVQSDIIMVKYIAGDYQAGYYNASFSILTAIMIFPTVLYQKFFIPRYHRWSNSNRIKFFDAYKKGNLSMLVFGIVIMLILFFTSDIMIPLVFGNEFYNSIKITKILSLAIPIYFVSYSTAATLVTQDNMKKKMKYMGITAIINIILNYFLIIRFHAIGAAIATFISYALLLSIYLYATKKYVFLNEFNS